jgi:hydrogenase maturation protein HypF
MKRGGTKSLHRGQALRITVFGVVQGVGFRPFIYRLAHRFGYPGWVKNIGAGVEIHVEAGRKESFAGFLRAIVSEKPPLARVEKLSSSRAAFTGASDFAVKKSRRGESFVFISPDISVCQNCRKDIADSRNRRFRYPFTNCTDCGPRYTIVRALPYDRPNTTMAAFKMCPECAAEYENPLDRRYHAQPIACPKCGPSVGLHQPKSGRDIPGGIPKAAELIKNGKILAVKGLGGFHLVCDPLNPDAVRRLRKIKERQRKPLALMARDVETVEKYAHLTAPEKKILAGERRPIVLLRKKRDIPGVAPNLDEIGFMLPYTPLHELLLEELELIVATSSNKKDSPIMKEEDEGIRDLCDYTLAHNRPIEMRADDSVVKMVGDQPLFIRRARGFVPYPQKVPAELEIPAQILALGGELKDTISVYKNGYVVTSQFLGDLDEYENHLYFEETVRHLLKLFHVRPVCVVCDLHPDFHTTRFAQKASLPLLQVQHHHAHAAAVLLEHGIPHDARVLAVSWDGYGYGQDGEAWGGEFLLADYLSFERFARLEPVALPGADLAAKQPWRMALAYLHQAGLARSGDPPKTGILNAVETKKRLGILEMIRAQVRSPLSSSCGRLFDAVSALSGLAPLENEFEAEAAMRLEAAASSSVISSYPFEIIRASKPFDVSFRETIRHIVSDIEDGAPPSRISAKFHNTLARVIAEVSLLARKEAKISTVVLVGGVFLNRKLLGRALAALKADGFRVLRPLEYSPNDESLSIGQIAHALVRLKKDPGFTSSPRLSFPAAGRKR